MKDTGAEIISVGNELVQGVHVDLNAPRLARGLLGIGLATQHFTTVPDDLDLLAAALKTAAGRAGVVLVTGGLGPTEDDISRHAAAAAAGVSLDLDEAMVRSFQEEWKKRGRQWKDSNQRSALFPSGSTVLPNGVGTAPGFLMQLGGAKIFFLPGPPGEAEQMLEAHVLPRLQAELGSRGQFAKHSLHFIGIPESAVGEKINDRMQSGRNPRLGTTVRKGILTIHIFAQGESAAEAQKLVTAEAAEIRKLFGPYYFGEQGKTFQEALGELLLERRITVATAESCTGGLVGKLLTDCPGISAVYLGGFITYSNQQKVKSLGVSPEVLETHGAVSEETAAAMAEGAAQATGAKLGIATTGIAGPGGGTPEKPVGLVYEAVCYEGQTTVRKRIWPPGDRKRIRDYSARDALNLARKAILGL